MRSGFVSRQSKRVVLAIALLVGLWVSSASLAGGMPWAGATYRGHATGALSKGAVSLAVAATGTTIPTYTFQVDTLCGKDNLGGNKTYIWPINNQGSPPLAVNSTGTFRGSQHGRFTAPAIPGVTSAPESATYTFSVNGGFEQGGTAFSGHMTLNIKTDNGYFCVDTNGAFSGKRDA